MIPCHGFWLQLPQPRERPSHFLWGLAQVTSNQRPSCISIPCWKFLPFGPFCVCNFLCLALLSIISPSEEWAHYAWHIKIEHVLGRSKETQSFKFWQQCRGETIDSERVCWRLAVNIVFGAEIKTRYGRLIRICRSNVVLHFTQQWFARHNSVLPNQLSQSLGTQPGALMRCRDAPWVITAKLLRCLTLLHWAL